MVQSTWFQMTPEILLEYRTDRKRIIQGGKSTDQQPSRYYIYKANDGRIVYTEDNRYPDKNNRNWYKNQSVWQKFPDFSGASYRWIKGDFDIADAMDYTVSDLITYQTIVNNSAVNEEATEQQSVTLDVNMFYDSVNIYFLRGYEFDSLDGATLRVWANAACQEVSGDATYKSATQVNLLDAYIDKSMLYPDEAEGRSVSPFHFLASPLYMNSKFYDKYITIEFPSPYAIGLRDHDVIDDDSDIHTKNDPTILMVYFNEDGTMDTSKSDLYTVDLDSNIIVEFGTIPYGETSKTEAKIKAASDAEQKQVDAIMFTPDKLNSGCVIPQSNIDFFNARIYEDGKGSIIYCPMYGDVELNSLVMGQIQTGEIPVTSNAFHDADTSYEKFNDIDTGDDSLYYADKKDEDTYLNRWKVYSDLVATYVYTHQDATGSSYSLTYDESYSRIIDYGQNRNSSVEFWKTKFTPDKEIIRQLGAERICLKYTCRLVNEMRHQEAVRIATLFINPMNYTDNISGQLNVNTYKIVNRITAETGTQVRTNVQQKERLIRTYYNMTQVVAKDMGTGNVSYPQGQMTLKLNKTANDYAIQLFNISSDNVRIPYDLTGPYKYRLVLSSGDGTGQFSIKQSQNADRQQLGLGTLMFRISGEQAAQAMNVPSDKRYFAIMTDNGSGVQDTVLYEGKVSWL